MSARLEHSARHMTTALATLALCASVASAARAEPAPAPAPAASPSPSPSIPFAQSQSNVAGFRKCSANAFPNAVTVAPSSTR